VAQADDDQPGADEVGQALVPGGCSEVGVGGRWNIRITAAMTAPRCRTRLAANSTEPGSAAARVPDQFGPRCDLELAEDPAQVVVDGAAAAIAEYLGASDHDRSVADLSQRYADPNELDPSGLRRRSDPGGCKCS
jgi:hypothetical protein